MGNDYQELLHEAIHQLKTATGIETIAIDDLYQRVIINGIRFGCTIKKTISNANILSTIDTVKRESKATNIPKILIANKIYPKQVNQLAENKISWIDRSGNCEIRHENLLIKVVGQKNNTAFKVTATCKISETSMKIILFFLQHPDTINLSYRDIQDKVGYSLGTITKVFDLLKANNYLVQTENGRKIAMHEELVEWWQQQYNEFLKPKLLVCRMAFRSPETRKHWKEIELPQGVYWGGDCGAHLLDGYLIPGEFELYTDVVSTQLLKTGAVIPDAQGEIKIYKKFWIGNSKDKFAPALVIYADLMGTGDSRCRGAALRMKERSGELSGCAVHHDCLPVCPSSNS